MRAMLTVNITKPILHRTRRSLRWALTLGLLLAAGSATAGSILFIGNSFTYAHGSAVRYYRADTVSDLNGGGQGGVPALFKSFAAQAGWRMTSTWKQNRGSASIGTWSTSST